MLKRTLKNRTTQSIHKANRVFYRELEKKKNKLCEMFGFGHIKRTFECGTAYFDTPWFFIQTNFQLFDDVGWITAWVLGSKSNGIFIQMTITSTATAMVMQKKGEPKPKLWIVIMAWQERIEMPSHSSGYLWYALDRSISIYVLPQLNDV